jgi:hypothetical protein
MTQFSPVHPKNPPERVIIKAQDPRGFITWPVGSFIPFPPSQRDPNIKVGSVFIGYTIHKNINSIFSLAGINQITFQHPLFSPVGLCRPEKNAG